MQQLKEWLATEAEPDYRNFSASLIPNCTNVLGVRIPKLRKKAKEIAKSEYWHEFLNSYECEYMEELLLQGMVIGYLKLTTEEHLTLVKNYIPKITNWSLCDCFCCGLKFTTKNCAAVWKFLQPYLASKDEYELRFGVVMLLNFFVTDEWIDRVLDKLFSLNSDDYYAQMGIAWAISICAVKFFDKTYARMKEISLPPVIFKKSVQKSCESFRLTKEQKSLLRSLDEI